jgi:hypothetical protein
VSSHAALVRFLLKENPGKARFGNWRLARVGRNRVWRCSRAKEAVFVKVTTDEGFYHRELSGIKTTQVLAAAHDWISPCELVFAEESSGVVMTKSIPGQNLAKLFRSAFRISRNPLRRAAPIAEFLAAMESMLMWLHHLHSLPLVKNDNLYDHTIQGVGKRVAVKLSRAAGTCGWPADLSQLYTPSTSDPATSQTRLVTGDANFGNFVWDGHRIGRVDFEHFGWGSPHRDFVEVAQALEAARRKWGYWSPDVASALLPDIPDFESTLHALEWTLDRHWHATQQQARQRERLLAANVKELLRRLQDAC